VLLWTIALLALAAALVALSVARRLARRLDPAETRDPEPVQPASSVPGASTVSFVPLSSIRKKDS